MKYLITLLFLFTSISFSQDFWEKLLDIPLESEFDSYVNSIAANSNGDLYTFYYYDCNTDDGCKEVFLYSEDSGNTWLEKSIIDTNSVLHFFEITINDQGHIFAWVKKKGIARFTPDSSIFRSTDNGETWSMLSDFGSEELAINSNGVIYSMGYKNLLRSTDNGDSWTNLDIDIGNASISCLYIDNNDDVYIGTTDFYPGKIYRSKDNGINWTNIGSGFEEMEIYGVLKNSKGDLFILSRDENWYTSIYRSTDDGNTMTKSVGSFLPRVNAFRPIDWMIDNNDNIYIYGGLDKGIYLSKDNGNSWSPLKSCLTNVDVYCLVQNVDGYLFVGTNGGLYRSKDPITSIKENVSSEILPNKVLLYQNYPNPFNPNTKIKYSIPKQSNVTLKVFNVLGSEVATLVNREQPQGNYEVEFDGSKLTSGIYFYRLQAGDYVETRKMILLK